MSSRVGDLLKEGDVTIKLDLFPDIDPKSMKETLYSILSEDSNKKIKNSLTRIIQPALVKPFLKQANIDPDKSNHSVTKIERMSLLNLFKSIELNVQNLLGANKAVVSSGGVNIDEVNFKTMESRKVPKLFITGDLLNIDRPSGGYSLQICWASGYISGNNA
ncbi:MAG: NAD(P)/FAD-dependent oxidoreductase [Candidatus Dojkabacteria bacterium]|nr:NAD(P)/FAD-dependent oxidoreductase [Candidatus Dojkabacteria bacterium]MDQ7021647.1 NAD(P)/FAD-dependent oxidoreductase [Candidatus Dojkabacteria bacterium]